MPAVVAALVATLLATPAAQASTPTTPVTDLSSWGGYNSVQLTWTVPTGQPGYRGVTIWRQVGNTSDATPVLVATLGSTATTYRDAGLAVPPTGVWQYTVYTRDATAGPIAPQTTAASLRAAVSGRVTDAQGNGVGGVVVELGYHGWGGPDATTNADGTWLADGQVAYTFDVCFDPRNATGGGSRTGYQPQCYRNSPNVPADDAAGSTPVTLSTGKVVTGVDAVLAAAGGFSGVVHDRRGHVLTGAGVEALRSDGRVMRNVVTGSDGAFRITGLAAGSYSVCAYQPFSSPAISPASPYGYLDTCSDGSAESAQPAELPVTAGTVSAVGITLADAGVITGRLLAPDGTPLAGQLPRLGGTYAPRAQITPTGSDGRYRITGLSPGSYTVCFDGTPSSGSGTSFDPGAAPRCWRNADPSAPTPVAVSLGQVTSAVSVQEYRNSTIRGKVVDPSGAPVSGVGVRIDNWPSAGTGADGTFQVGVAPGSHTVCFDASQATGPSASGYRDQCWEAQPAGGTPTPVVVARGATVGMDATLVIAPGVKVIVVDAHGTALRNVMVIAGGAQDRFTGKYGVVIPRVLGDVGSTVDVSAGSVDFSGVTPASPTAYVPTSKTVTLKPGLQTVKLVVPSYASIAGTVTGPDGAPLANAVVSVRSPSYAMSWSTAADGTYTAARILPGTYTVCASGWVGVAPDSRSVTACWKAAVDAAHATPVVVGDGAAVTGIDLQLE